MSLQKYLTGEINECGNSGSSPDTEWAGGISLT